MQHLPTDTVRLPTEINLQLPTPPFDEDSRTFLWKEQGGGGTSVPMALSFSAREIVRRLREIADGIEGHLTAKR